jgi:hypothetical protein
MLGNEDWLEIKRNLAPKSLEWRLTRLAETMRDLWLWWIPKR